MLYYVDTTIFNGLEALLLTHSNLQLRSCHQVTLHDIYDRWRTITILTSLSCIKDIRDSTSTFCARSRISSPDRHFEAIDESTLVCHSASTSRGFGVRYNGCLWEILIFLHLFLNVPLQSLLLFQEQLAFTSLQHI